MTSYVTNYPWFSKATIMTSCFLYASIINKLNLYKLTAIMPMNLFLRATVLDEVISELVLLIEGSCAATASAAVVAVITDLFLAVEAVAATAAVELLLLL